MSTFFNIYFIPPSLESQAIAIKKTIGTFRKIVANVPIEFYLSPCRKAA
jgi:hypothetical protein